MKSIFESATAFFAQENWPVRQLDGAAALSMHFKGEHGEWNCMAQAMEDERTLVFYSTCPVVAPASAYATIAELLHRINYCQVSGNFELGYKDGDIRLRTAIEVPDQELTHALLDRVVYNNVSTMDLYLPAILAVIEHGAAPLDAIVNM